VVPKAEETADRRKAKSKRQTKKTARAGWPGQSA